MEQAREESKREQVALAGLAAYFMISVIVRIFISPTADMDETETLIYAQALRPGYGAQLPLYAWLQYLVSSILGTNLFSVSILKYSLLFSTYACIAQIARKALKDSMGATIAVLSLFLIPQVVWESYRTLSNTVLATFMAAVSLLLMLRLKEKSDVARYLFFGIAAGLGMLSKYNYSIFFLALILAGVSIPSYRRHLLSIKSVVSLVMVVIITTPPYLWILSNMDKATSSSQKLKAFQQGSFVMAAFAGLLSLIAAWIGYFWPALIVYGVLFAFFKPVRDTSPDQEVHLLLKRTLMAAFFICTLLLLFFSVTYFKERWMQPVLFILPIFFMHYLTPRINAKRFRGVVATTLVPALMAMLVFSGGVLLASSSGRVTRLSPPYKAMALTVKDKGFGGGTIITNDHRIGGNFRLHFKDSNILVTEMPEVPFNRDDPTLIIWNADKDEKIPEQLLEYSVDLLDISLEKSQIGYLEEPLLYWPDKTMRLGYIRLNQ